MQVSVFDCVKTKENGRDNHYASFSIKCIDGKTTSGMISMTEASTPLGSMYMSMFIPSSLSKEEEKAVEEALKKWSKEQCF